MNKITVIFTRPAMRHNVGVYDGLGKANLLRSRPRYGTKLRK
jgi:hypothetical protein